MKTPMKDEQKKVMILLGDRVDTEFGQGVVTETKTRPGSPGRIVHSFFVQLDDGTECWMFGNVIGVVES